MYTNWVLFLVLGFLSTVIPPQLCLAQNGVRPATVNVGALVAYNTSIGRVAKKAIELALEDVNNDKTLLNGTQLVLTMMDSNCSAFIGTAAALELMKKNNAAIVGPQSSVIAHVVSHIASELQVPILSFGATDPTLSSYQYPYFLRMVHSDAYGMMAIASVIGNFGWRDIVVVYVDDDYGRNGISALSDALGNVRAKIVNKVAFPPGVSKAEIENKLVTLALMESRIFVVHMNPDVGMNLFSVALNLEMLSSSYVWIATDWLSSLLDSNMPDYEAMNSLQGVIALRRHIPISDQEHTFTMRWNNLYKDRSFDVRLSAFGLYAYDAIWTIARSLDTFLSKGGNISFTGYPKISNASGSKTELAKLKVFAGGAQLREILLQSNFTGLTGPVKFDKQGDLVGSSFQIINVIGTGFRKVSYWTNQSGLSVIPPETRVANSHNQHTVDQKVYDIVWPGQNKLVPRGWVFPNNNGKQLVIAVPRKVGFQELVTAVEGTMKGFVIDVFLAAVTLLPYGVPYKFVPFGNGKSSPNYDELVREVASKNFDAAVGDILIVTNRSKIVDFTQPYIESGLAVVTPLRENNPSGTWAFLQPFTLEMWCTTAAFFVVIGAVVWILEHKSNPEFRGHPQKQALTILWFSFSTLFFSHRENVVSNLGRAVLLIWLFVVLIINSSYTASLTSILTVQQLSATVKGIDSLIASKVPIGYQEGTFVARYLSEEFGIDKSRLIGLNSTASYARALQLGPSKGGVAAVVDSLPIIQLFLSTQCGFTTVGPEFTKGGWGFAFQKDSQLAIDMSTAILTLSENGELQRIHDKWFSKNRCGSQDTQVDSTRLQLKSFWGLFLISGLASFIALLVFLVRMIFQFIQYSRNQATNGSHSSASSSLASRSARIIKQFASFIDEREIDERKEGSVGSCQRSPREESIRPTSTSDHFNPSWS